MFTVSDQLLLLFLFM